MIKFTIIKNETDFNYRMERVATPVFVLDEVWLNPQSIMQIRPAPHYKKLLSEGCFPKDLKEEHDFSLITVNNGSHTETYVAIGNHSFIARRVENAFKGTKDLLKG